MSGKLIVVGTPIGNLNDFSERAIQALKDSDFIAAEDTRVTLKLLNHFNIKKPMVSYFEHNKMQKGELICSRILKGENCVLVSDAGMPAISDPGEELVRQCIDMNIKVSVVPGPNAAVSALAISGLPTGRFTFEGFLSVNKKRRIEHLNDIVNEKRTLIFYEAPHKLAATLKDLYEYLGNREIAIIRELTKIYEEVIRTTLFEASRRYSEEKIKGEIVLIIEGKSEDIDEPQYTIEQVKQLAKSMQEEGETLSVVAKKIAKLTGLKKREIYKALLNE